MDLTKYNKHETLEYELFCLVLPPLVPHLQTTCNSFTDHLQKFIDVVMNSYN